VQEAEEKKYLQQLSGEKKKKGREGAGRYVRTLTTRKGDSVRETHWRIFEKKRKRKMLEVGG